MECRLELPTLLLSKSQPTKAELRTPRTPRQPCSISCHNSSPFLPPPPLLLNCQVAAPCRLGQQQLGNLREEEGEGGRGGPRPRRLSTKNPAVPTKSKDTPYLWPPLRSLKASLAQLVEHALRKRMVVGSIPTGGSLSCRGSAFLSAWPGE